MWDEVNRRPRLIPNLDNQLLRENEELATILTRHLTNFFRILRSQLFLRNSLRSSLNWVLRRSFLSTYLAVLEKTRLQEIVSNFSGKSVLVVGDLMVDRYQSIIARKISREAPVPVGDLQGERLSLGGAGNLANNVLALGGKAQVPGFVGEDSQGEWIRKDLVGFGS